MNMTYRFWRNAAALSAIVGSVGLAGYAMAAPNNLPPAMTGNGQSQGLHLGWENGNPQNRGQIHTLEQREQIWQAVKAGNYEQWKSLIMVDGQIPKQFENITADNFAKLAEMHTAMEAKDFEKSKALRQELGLMTMGPRNMGRGNPQNRGQIHTPEQREQILQAIKAGNYEQWKALITVDGQIPKQFANITADNFAKLAEMHTAMEAKDLKSPRL